MAMLNYQRVIYIPTDILCETPIVDEIPWSHPSPQRPFESILRSHHRSPRPCCMERAVVYLRILKENKWTIYIHECIMCISNVYIYIYIFIHIHTYIYIYLFIHRYIHMYIYIYVQCNAMQWNGIYVMICI